MAMLRRALPAMEPEILAEERGQVRTTLNATPKPITRAVWGAIGRAMPRHLVPWGLVFHVWGWRR